MVVEKQRKNRVYSEVQFDRKLRDERRRWPVAHEDNPSEQMCRCVRGSYLSFTARTAKLTPFERRAFILRVNGASLRQIAFTLKISNQRACRLMSIVAHKLRRVRTNKYYGLYEVYWQEVRRYVYRKPQHGSAAGMPESEL